MGTKIVFVFFILLQCNFSWAIKPLPKAAKGEGPPVEILEAIEEEKEMKEEVIQKKKEEESKEIPREIATERPVPMQKTAPKGPSITIIITALVILLISFYIYRRK